MINTHITPCARLPDLDQSARFLHLLDPDAQYFTFQSFPESSDAKLNKIQARVLHGTLDEHANTLTNLNLAGCGIFVTVNHTDGRGRKAGNIQHCRAVWSDDDNGFSGEYPIPPHIVVKTSNHDFPKKQIYWLCEATLPIDDHKSIMEVMSKSFGNDPNAKDISRVLRLPGFFHLKNVPQMVEVLSTHKGPRYSPEALKASFSVPSTSPPNTRYRPYELRIGNRNSGLASIAGSMRRKGASESQIFKVLASMNDELDDALNRSEISSIARSIAKYRPSEAIISDDLPYSKQNLACTDAGMAERFIEITQSTIRYAHQTKQWIHWNGIHWDEIEKPTEQAIAVARSVHIEAAKELDGERRKELSRLAKNAENKARLNAMIDIATELPSVFLKTDQLDQIEHLIACPNAVLDLRTGTEVPPSPDDFITKTISANFDRSATAPRFEQFLNEIVPDQEEIKKFLQTLFGYCLLKGNPEHVFPIFIGTGANGKSVLVNLMRHIFGQYARVAAPETIMTKSNKSGGSAREDLVRLRGARLAVISESAEADRLDEALIKSITGGDSHTARTLYATKSVEISADYLPILTTNHPPRIKGTDDGIWRRLVPIHFKQTFAKDQQNPKILEELKEESSGILNWLLSGTVEYFKNGLQIPESIELWRKQYRDESDLLGQWISDECELGPDFSERTSDLRSSLFQWNIFNGIQKTRSVQGLGRELSARGFETKKINGQSVRVGIRIKKEDPSKRIRDRFAPL